MTSTTETKQHLFDVLKGFDTAMLVTHSGNGLHVRPMAIAELRPDADMYFSTSLQSPKIAEIDANPAVSVTFQSRAQFASVHGNAYIVRDRALIEKLWSEAWRIWFPGGKDDPSLCLIRVEAREGEYCWYTRCQIRPRGRQSLCQRRNPERRCQAKRQGRLIDGQIFLSQLRDPGPK